MVYYNQHINKRSEMKKTEYTSLRIRKKVRDKAKRFAKSSGMKLEAVVEMATENFLSKNTPSGVIEQINGVNNAS